MSTPLHKCLTKHCTNIKSYFHVRVSLSLSKFISAPNSIEILKSLHFNHSGWIPPLNQQNKLFKMTIRNHNQHFNIPPVCGIKLQCMRVIYRWLMPTYEWIFDVCKRHTKIVCVWITQVSQVCGILDRLKSNLMLVADVLLVQADIWHGSHGECYSVTQLASYE